MVNIHLSLSMKVLITSFLLFIVCGSVAISYGFSLITGIISVIGIISFFTFLGTLIFRGRHKIWQTLFVYHPPKPSNHVVTSDRGNNRPQVIVINNNPRPREKPFHIFDFGQHAENLGKTLTPPAHRPKGYKRTHLEELIEDE